MVAGIDDMVSLSGRKDQDFCLLVPARGDNGSPEGTRHARQPGGGALPLPRDHPIGGRIMAAFDEDDRPKRKIVHEIGQDLSLLSVEELSDRIALLEDEIVRLEAAREKKRASRSAADQFFKR
jgi:uncharacterized small protein (DUF1192 family)